MTSNSNFHSDLTPNRNQTIANFLFCLFLVFGVVTYAEATEDALTGQSLKLTQVEQKWLGAHKNIRIAYDGAFEPYSFSNADGAIEGIAVDFMALISKLLGNNFVVYPKSNWNDLYNAMGNHKVDVIATMVDRPDRRLWFNFTKPYLTKSLVIVTKNSNQTLKGKEDIAGKKIVLTKDYEYSDRVLKEQPKIQHLLVKSMREGFNAVKEDKADAAITFLATANYLQRSQPENDLKIAGFYERDSANESIAVRGDWPILANILQKALDSITEEEKQLIYAKWMPEIKPVQPATPAPVVNQAPPLVAPSPKNSLIENSSQTLLAALLISWLLWFLHSNRNRQVINKLTKNVSTANNRVQTLQADMEDLALKRTQDLNSAGHKFKSLMENLRYEYFFYQQDKDGIFTYVSPAVTSVLGYSPDEFMANFHAYLTDDAINHPIKTQKDNDTPLGLSTTHYELEIIDAKKSIHWLEIIDSPVYDEYGNCIGVDGFVHDITSRKQLDEHLIWLSYYDEITGLASKQLFFDRLQQIIFMSKRHKSSFTCIYAQLGWFDENGTTTDEATDAEVLRQTADRFLINSRNSDIVSRFERDKFALVLPETDIGSAMVVANKILESLEQPFKLGNTEYYSVASLGISIYPDHSQSGESLLKLAEQAMNLAKLSNQTITVYAKPVSTPQY